MKFDGIEARPGTIAWESENGRWCIAHSYFGSWRVYEKGKNKPVHPSSYGQLPIYVREEMKLYEGIDY